MPFSVSGDRPGHFDIRLVLGQICVNLDCPKSAQCKISKQFYGQKILKTGGIFWEEAQRVCTFVKTAAKKALFSSHTTAR